jgi:hypothetical protein
MAMSQSTPVRFALPVAILAAEQAKISTSDLSPR